jgi:hypothetical protein
MRYTLGEMTVIWEVFGGQDFPKLSSTSFPSKRFLILFFYFILTLTVILFIVIPLLWFFCSKNKFHRTVSFSKDSQEQVKIRPSAENKSHLAGSSSSGGRRLQNHTGGCNRQQDVKLELQMNKVYSKYTIYRVILISN